ncbi:hypothetical protein [Flavobacterium sp. LB2P44]|uniref:hypothetical protein n=1 Tax=Flavobacterium sp. LB2P44 TaxID=3401713 RepID=UPI003AABC1F6
MKRIILMLSLTMLMFSCSNESKMKSEIKNYLDKNAKDPKSYEFVELKILDTVTVGSISEDEIEENNRILKDNDEAMQISKTTLGKAIKLNKQYNDNSFDEHIIGATTDIKAIEKENFVCNKQIAKYRKTINSKEVLGYVATHKFRIKNGFGALDLDEMWVEFDKDFKLLKMDKSPNFDVFKK